MPENKPVPIPVKLALEALNILAVEDAALTEGSRKKLPGFALRLAAAGEEVTVERLLASARAKEIDRVPEPKQRTKTYEEIVAAFSVDKPFESAREQSKAQIAENALKTGDIDTVKRLVSEGLDIEGPLIKVGVESITLPNRAASLGRLEVVKYLVEECGVDLGTMGENLLLAALRGGHLNVIRHLVEEYHLKFSQFILRREFSSISNVELMKYLVEKQGLDKLASYSALSEAVQKGHLDIVKYLVEECNIDTSHAGRFNQSAQYWAITEFQYDIANYLIEERGAEGLSDWMLGYLRDYAEASAEWSKVAHAKPLDTFYREDPRFFRPVAYQAVHDMLRQEAQYHPERMAFRTAGLFGTEDRVLQYLEKWGSAGKQPLHDIIQMIRLPKKKMPEMDVKAWGDAVLKCGPSMAKLVKFADRLSTPEKSDDGRTWSMVKTREKVALITYDRGAENPRLASICFEHAVHENDFNTALELAKNPPAVKNVPDITLAGEQFDMPGATFHRLAVDDVRGLFLGEMTDCCQSIGGGGEACAKHGFTSEDSGFYVVENAKGKVVGQTWAWRGQKGELVFDSLETLGENVKPEQWQKLTKNFAQAMAKAPNNDVTAFHVGTGGATPSSLVQTFNEASSPAKPLGYNGYRDSHDQVIVWRAGKKLRVKAVK